MAFQRTIERKASLSGFGIHSGRQVCLTVHPAEEDSGIIFIRADLSGRPKIKASPECFCEARRSSSLGMNNARINTVEHLLSAAFGLGIDNLTVEVDGPELPIGDGSASPFLSLLNEAGIKEQTRPRNVLKLMSPIFIIEGDASIVALPDDKFSISYTFVSDHPAIGCQFAEYVDGVSSFVEEIAPARTLGFTWEIEALRKQGLGLGGSLDSALVADETSFVTPQRLINEVARHKVLDAIGDLSVAGRINMRVLAIRSGHALNQKLSTQIAKYIKTIT